MKRFFIVLYVIMITLCFWNPGSRILMISLLAILSGSLILITGLSLKQIQEYHRIKDPNEQLVWLNKKRWRPLKLSEVTYWNLASNTYFSLNDTETALVYNDNYLHALNKSTKNQTSRSYQKQIVIFMNNRCVYLAQLERFEELEPELIRLREYLLAKPNPFVQSNYDYHCALLAIYYKDPDTAKIYLEAYKKGKQVPHANGNIRLLEAKILHLQGQTEAARGLITIALETNPELTPLQRQTYENFIAQL